MTGRRHAAGPICALALLLAGAAVAQNLEPATFEACAGIETDALRLACYDQAAGRTGVDTALPEAPALPVPTRPDRNTRLAASPATPAAPDEERASLLDNRWELDPARKLGTFNLRGYKPVFIEPIFATSHVNQLPSTPNADNTVRTPLGLRRHEAKFQLSLKTKIAEGLFGGHGDLWGAYTQVSYWQVYNSDLSRPFRETDYEPEAMLLFDTNVPFAGWRLRMLGAGLNHQSNGRSEPLSRSWNRLMGYVGIERPGWVVIYRPWWRVYEKRRHDDNPDIERYLGRGEVQVVHVRGRQEFGLLARHRFSTGRGAGRLTWSFPAGRGVRGYLELFNGYGESLIDYNHHGTYVGLGVTLLDWF